jgi:acyl carrier protein
MSTRSPGDDASAGLADAASVPLPASGFQQRIWLAERLDPAAGRYNVPLAWRVRGRLEPNRLSAALAALTHRHEMLRTRFVDHDGGVRPALVAPWRPPVRRVDLSRGEGDPAAWLRAAADEPFDLAAGPPLRVALLELPAGRQLLFVAVHHLIWDAASTPVFLRELAACYADPAATTGAARQFRHVVADRDGDGGPEQAGRLAYWAEQLAGAPPYLDLRPGGGTPTGPHGTTPIPVPAGTLARLAAVRRQVGGTWFTLVAGACLAVLHDWTGRDDVTVGCPITGRGPADADVIGPCLDTVVLRSRCRAGERLADLLGDVRDTVLSALEHGAPFADVVDLLGPARRPGWTPYADVMIATDAAAAEPARVGGAVLTPYQLHELGAGYQAKVGVTIAFAVTGGQLTARLTYRGDRLDAASAARLAGRIGDLLGSLGDRRESLVLAGPATRRPNEVRRGPDPTSRVPPPGRELADRITAVWADVLGRADVGVRDNFFDLGGNSLLLAKLHARLEAELDVTLAIQDLFEHPTVAALTQALTPASTSPATPLDGRARAAAARGSRARAGAARARAARRRPGDDA